MVARTQPAPALVVSFVRGGEILSAETAPNGEIALQVAFALLEEQTALQDGDRIMVVGYDGKPDLPEVSRSSHYS